MFALQKIGLFSKQVQMKETICWQIDKIIDKTNIISILIKCVIIGDVFLYNKKIRPALHFNFKDLQTIQCIGR